LTTIFSRSARVQPIFHYGHWLPTPLEEAVVCVPVSGINPARIYTKQTEPPLRVVLQGGRYMNLSTGAFDISYYMDDATGGAIITGGTTALSFTSDGDPVFTYDWIVGDTTASGVYDGQFRVVRKADNKSFFTEIFSLRIYQAV
jgi:hypothetical protein